MSDSDEKIQAYNAPKGTNKLIDKAVEILGSKKSRFIIDALLRESKKVINQEERKNERKRIQGKPSTPQPD